MSPEWPVAELDGVLDTVAVWFCVVTQVVRTTAPSAVALKCAEIQLAQRALVELAEPSSARKFEPVL